MQPMPSYFQSVPMPTPSWSSGASQLVTSLMPSLDESQALLARSPSAVDAEAIRADVAAVARDLWVAIGRLR